MNPFDVKTVRLEGSNIVEASAGTGKTFSIGILSIRLIIEKNIPIDKILMVTFTNAAVAELEARIRKFVRIAHNVALTGVRDNNNGVISDIVLQPDPALGLDAATVLERLEKAKRALDETSIMTIHSFCQSVLSEYAFETDQTYGVELLLDIGQLIANSVNEFWRQEVTSIDTEVLKILLAVQSVRVPHSANLCFINRGILMSAVQNAYDQKEFRSESIPMNRIGEVVVKRDAIYDHVLNKDWQQYIDHCIATINGVGPSYQKWVAIAENPEEFYHQIAKSVSAKVAEIFEEELILLAEYNDLKRIAINGVVKAAIDYAEPVFKRELSQRNQMSMNDMIIKVHRAVAEELHEGLIRELRSKYTAAFIDEFQDTDHLQYEIFNTLFNEENSILFYIGDPKQSIYGWRKADINTYFNAVENIDPARRYTMNTNFRSASNLIDAMNVFFLPETNFDTFATASTDNDILYRNVNAFNSPSTLHLNGAALAPISINDEYERKNDIFDDAINLVRSLLENGEFVKQDGTVQLISPADIAILVRSGFEGGELRSKLMKLGIPAITITDEKVFESGEAMYVLYVLETIHEISWKGINKALLNPFTGLTSRDLLTLDTDHELNRFKTYQKIWKEQGIYPVITQYISDYRVKSNLLRDDNPEGERIISNLYQLSEILQRSESENKFSPGELIRFLKRSIEGAYDDSDEYIQRIESDEQAVQIATIHKSKGLEYNIVVAPFLDFTVSEKGAFTGLRDEHGTYIFKPHEQLGDDEDAWRVQTEQENRRLLYVAITRAKYNCFIFKGPGRGGSSLAPFYDVLKDHTELDGKIDIKPYEMVLNLPLYNRYGNALPPVYTPIPDVSIGDWNWRKMSYSYLAGEHSYRPKEIKKDAYPEGSYNQFIFKDLPKGAHVGNLLHNIFEFIDFTDEKENWMKTIDISIARFLPGAPDSFRDQLLSMVGMVLSNTLQMNGSSVQLSKLSNTNKRNELEFDFTTSAFRIHDILEVEGLLPDEFEIHTRKNDHIEGILNGLIDMFFEYDGKYYILDWKSNFLGDTLEDYETDKVIQAMNENNYHLQYLIYTVAMKRYLKTKMDFNYDRDFGGVIYLFLRGVREGQETGIFYHKPDIKVIEKLENILAR